MDVQSLNLYSWKQNDSPIVDLKPNQFPTLYWPKFSAKFSLNNRFCEILSKESKDEWQHFFPKATRLLKFNEALQANITKSVMKRNMVTAI